MNESAKTVGVGNWKDEVSQWWFWGWSNGAFSLLWHEKKKLLHALWKEAASTCSLMLGSQKVKRTPHAPWCWDDRYGMTQGVKCHYETWIMEFVVFLIAGMKGASYCISFFRTFRAMTYLSHETILSCTLPWSWNFGGQGFRLEASSLE